MKIELLYFDECPSYERLLPKLRALVAEHARGDEVELLRVDSDWAAARERFLGSPTVRVDGEDVDASASSRSDFGLKCRLYRVGGEYSAIPPDEWIVIALERAARRAE